MLIKKELLTIEPCKYKKIKAKDFYHYAEYAEFAKEADLPKSGHVIEADYYKRKTGELFLRTFYDGINVINYNTREESWSDAKPSGCLGLYSSGECVSAQCAMKIHKKLQVRKRRYADDSILGYLDDMVSEKWAKKRDRAWERERKLFAELSSMLPDYPERLPEYCEKNIYGFTYIFIGKINHNRRTAVCANCGAEFKVDKSVKPHQHGTCPKCGEKAEYFADWVKPPHEKVCRICICCKSHGNLILRWVKIQRLFIEGKTEYTFYDYFWNFYIHSGEKAELYSYHYVENMWDSSWVRLKNGDENTKETYIYTPSLRRVFGKNIYGVDLAEELRGCKDEISITRMLDSLKNIPQAKYFLHMGLRRLTQDMWDPPYTVANNYTGKTFAEVFGVRAQYLPMYKKYDVTMPEHAAIKACGAWVDEDMFLKMCEMDVREYDIARNNGFLKTAATVKKSINYLYKQFKKYKNVCFGQLEDYWHDYLVMSAMLKVDISNKQIKFPKDLIGAHNTLADRTAAIKDRIKAEKVKKAFETIYTGIPEYRTKKYQVVFPQSEADFIREGQQLNHCVGCGIYFQRHIEGVNMIFFIRKTETPDKPFFTVEINVLKRVIVQLYGDHDCKAPKEIKDFAEQFIKHIEPRTGIAAVKEKKSA